MATLSLSAASGSADPHSMYAEMRRSAAICSSSDKPGDWVILSHSLVNTVLANAAAFSSRPALEVLDLGDAKCGRVAPSIPLNLDEPYHRAYRNALIGALGRVWTAPSRAYIQAKVDSLIDEWLDNGVCDFISQFARPLCGSLIFRLLGFPETDDADLLSWVTCLSQPLELPLNNERKDAAARLFNYVMYRTADQEADADTSVLNALMDAALPQRRSLPPMSDVINMAQSTIFAGVEPTTKAMGNALACLTSAPTIGMQLRERPGATRRAVEELLRWDAPLSATRVAVREIRVGDQPVAAGDILLLSIPSANRDATAIDGADRLDLDRVPNPHLTFGAGPHSCVGAKIARFAIEIVLERIFARTQSLRRATSSTLSRSAGQLSGVERLDLTVSPR